LGGRKSAVDTKGDKMTQHQSDNPYRPPVSTSLFSSGEPSYFSSQADPGITPKVVNVLGQTQPWVRFFSVLGFLGFALVIAVAAGIVLLALNAGRLEGAVVGALYGLFGLLYLVPAIFLSRFASDIARLRSTLRTEDLESALEAQKAFWRFTGFATVIGMVLMVFLLVFTAMAGVDFTSSPRSSF
jgi:hypothetical protein